MEFQVLISTMFKVNLNFLEPIFINNNISDYNIIVVNQTDKDSLLKSNLSNVIVYNSFERGTSASRNLAIEKASAKYALFADDDTVFDQGFDQIILNEFAKYSDAYLLSFECTTGENKVKHTKYPKPGLHNRLTLKPIHMVVMAVNLEILKKSGVLFNKYFSLGGVFSGGTEYVFLREAYSKDLKSYHINKNIVHHHELSSGKFMGSDRGIHTRAARINHFHGVLYSYLWLFKYLFFLVKNDYINVMQLNSKFIVGKKGITDYNNLIKQGNIKRQL